MAVEDIIKGKGYIQEDFCNTYKKKQIREYYITHEQKKEYLKKEKIIQTASKKKPRGWGKARYNG